MDNRARGVPSRGRAKLTNRWYKKKREEVGFAGYTDTRKTALGLVDVFDPIINTDSMRSICATIIAFILLHLKSPVFRSLKA